MFLGAGKKLPSSSAYARVPNNILYSLCRLQRCLDDLVPGFRVLYILIVSWCSWYRVVFILQLPRG